MLKEHRQAINENGEETFRRQHKRLIKRKRGKDKDGQEGGPTFMITTAAAVQEVGMGVSARKASTKHTVSSRICMKIKVTTHGDDRDDGDGGDVDGGTSSGWRTFSSQNTRRTKRCSC